MIGISWQNLNQVFLIINLVAKICLNQHPPPKRNLVYVLCSNVYPSPQYTSVCELFILQGLVFCDWLDLTII